MWAKKWKSYRHNYYYCCSTRCVPLYSTTARPHSLLSSDVSLPTIAECFLLNEFHKSSVYSFHLLQHVSCKASQNTVPLVPYLMLRVNRRIRKPQFWDCVHQPLLRHHEKHLTLDQFVVLVILVNFLPWLSYLFSRSRFLKSFDLPL